MTFPADGLDFLNNLAENNNREWFQENKSTYDDRVKAPALAFVEEFGGRLREIAPNISYNLVTNGGGSLMRINRDTRFSEDKSPYKTNIGITFWEGNAKKKYENPSFHLDLWGDGAYMRAGMYAFPKAVLESYRQAVANDTSGEQLATIIAELKQANYSLTEPHYKRVPTGYPSDHPRAHLLLYKGLGATSPIISREQIVSDEFVDVCLEHARQMGSLHRWLVDSVTAPVG